MSSLLEKADGDLDLLYKAIFETKPAAGNWLFRDQGRSVEHIEKKIAEIRNGRELPKVSIRSS